MARDRIISAIDIGSSKIVILIASMTEEGMVRVIGVSTSPSHGLRKSQVVNIEEATDAISTSLEASERMAGASVTQVFVNIGGSHIASLNSHGVVAVSEPDKEITANDVKRVIDAAKAVQLPTSRDILHVLPRGYSVDGQEGIVDPVGMAGVRLEVETHLVTGGSTAIRNVHKCIEDLGVEVADVAFGGFVSAIATISDTEKELGVVLVDIGGGTTDVAIFVDGALSYSSVIPIGAINITKDLAAGLRVSLESAEKIKIRLGQVAKTPMLLEQDGRAKSTKNEKEDDLDIADLDLSEGIRTISKKTLIEGIIKPRLNEIFTMVALEIKRSGFGGMTPSGAVLTGGGALTIGVVESARRNLAMSVRIGIPQKVTGLVDEIMTPTYATAVGLLLWGDKEEGVDGATGSLFKGIGKFSSNLHMKGLAGKVINLVKSFLP